MSASPTSEPENDFVCECEDWMRSACADEPFYAEVEGRRYCILHDPSDEKAEDFRPVIQKRLEAKKLDFKGVYFPEGLILRDHDFGADANFCAVTFKGPVDFSHSAFRGCAVFALAKFESVALFNHAKFPVGAKFEEATFCGEALFNEVKFLSETDFRFVRFKSEANFEYGSFWEVLETGERGFSTTVFGGPVDFSGAVFESTTRFNRTCFENNAVFKVADFIGEVVFVQCTFSGQTDFSQANFKDHALFRGGPDGAMFEEFSAPNFRFVRALDPTMVSFHSLRLRPHSFVDVNARQFDFVNVEWDWVNIQKEIEALKSRNLSSEHRLLAIAYRDLAVNAEQNNRYDEASRFRYKAMDARRLETWRGFGFWKLSWWYWVASGYGEQIIKAFLVLLAIWFVSGLLYTRVGFARWEPRLASEADAVVAKRDDTGVPLNIRRALTYSAGVMTLQKPEPKPATTAAQTVVLVETILGPVQAALLALAIRRKFMR